MIETQKASNWGEGAAGRPMRRLAAIMFSDIVGYSQLMGDDERGTVALLDEQNALLLPIIDRHHGAVLKFIGDAVLASFDSASDAVQCAVEIQTAISKRGRENPDAMPLALRIGIHVGDIVQKDGDVYGDGVNIAARVQPLAAPGGVCVSQTVYDLLRAQAEFRAEPMGPHALKNIKGKINLYSVSVGAPAPRVPQVRRPRSRAFGALAAAGLVAALGAWRALALQARRRAQAAAEYVDADPAAQGSGRFTILLVPFAGTDEDANKEGKVMQSLVAKTIENNLRGNSEVEVIVGDKKSAVHTSDDARAAGRKVGATLVVWGEVMNLRGQIEIQPYLTNVEPARELSTSALDANVNDGNQLNLRKTKASEIGGLGLMAAARYYSAKNPDKALSLFQQVSPQTAESLLAQGYLYYNHGRRDEANGVFQRAAKEFPDYAMVYNALGNVYKTRGRYDEALAMYGKAIALKPLHPSAHYNEAVIFALRGELDKAAFEAANVIGRAPDFSAAYALLGEIYERQGRFADAAEQYRMAVVKAQNSNYSIVSELLYYFAMARAGSGEQAEKELKAYLAGSGVAAPVHAWPLPVARYLAGELSEEVLAVKLSEPSATARMRCTAFYCMGMKALLMGDRVKTRERFQAVLDTGVTYFFEYQQAKAQLGKL